MGRSSGIGHNLKLNNDWCKETEQETLEKNQTVNRDH